MSVDEDLRAERLPILQKFWEAVWIEEKPLKKEQATDHGVFHYLDFGEHLRAVQHFCGTVRNKLYIQQEYVDAFEMFESNSDIYEKGACIIGQPGIGKTCFIAYAVFERLHKKEPVAVEVTDWAKPTERYLLFTAEGVTLHGGHSIAALERHPGIWAFSDSNTDVVIPTTAFRHTPGVRTFQVTSPEQVRYKEWTKQSEVSHYIMNVPSEKDIHHLSLVLEKDVATMRSLAAKWGNIPHTLLVLHDNLDARHLREILVEQLMNESSDDISKALGALNALDATTPDGPSTIFFIQALRSEDGVLHRQGHDIYIPTPWLRNKVMKGLLRRDNTERMKLYRVMTTLPSGRSIAGCVFERIVHSFLSRGNELNVRWYKNSADPEPEPEHLTFPIFTTYPVGADLCTVGAPF